MLPDLSTKTRGKELPSLSSSSVKWKPSVANRVIFSGSLYTTLPEVFSIELSYFGICTGNIWNKVSWFLLCEVIKLTLCFTVNPQNTRFKLWSI